MAALDELNVSSLTPELDEHYIRQIIAGLFWTWYANNQDHKLTTVKIWFFSKALYIRDLKSVFELLFGPAQTI